MASMAFTTICSKSTFHPLHYSNSNASIWNAVPGMHSACLLQHESCKRQAYTNQARERSCRGALKPVCAAGSGLETSMPESKGSKLKFKNVKIAVELREADKIQLRVDLDGEDTQKAFDVSLANLANSAPVLPGFRRQKGDAAGKFAFPLHPLLQLRITIHRIFQIPKNLLMDILGKRYVMKFALQEIVKSAVATYVKEENLTVKDNQVTTTQTEDELYQSFLPGNGFGFNVEFELTNEQMETPEEPEKKPRLPRKIEKLRRMLNL
ncbi:hypothetical protein Cgig2_024452 [Carnegiea gigantea]|uniref:peptidylprolyl isomerase n=1 Tax=Carnegiea gigantea TaxID=171969 RepID=A0A9Q1QKS5_9CARY|nr:hypothetical protein Cgig2_024452 [Carnegiea gigantea]